MVIICQQDRKGDVRLRIKHSLTQKAFAYRGFLGSVFGRKVHSPISCSSLVTAVGGGGSCNVSKTGRNVRTRNDTIRERPHNFSLLSSSFTAGFASQKQNESSEGGLKAATSEPSETRSSTCKNSLSARCDHVADGHFILFCP